MSSRDRPWRRGLAACPSRSKSCHSIIALHRMQLRFLTRLAAVVLSFVLSLCAAEVAARATGHAPADASLAVQPWAAFDAELGWTNRPGVQIDAPAWKASFWKDASRPTRAVERTAARDVVLVLGCSYTQGYGIDDADTFAWKLQQRFPQYDFRNFGTGGYGTYQSLLRFRRLVRAGIVPKLVIFGFGDFHGVRDRATQSWMNQRGNARAFVPPHVDLVNGELKELPGRLIPYSTLSRWSGLWNWIEGEYARRENYVPDDEVATRAVHQAVLIRMREEIERTGATLLLTDLWTLPGLRPIWQDFFKQHHFHVAECVVDGLPPTHPDAFWSLLHADCIEHAMREQGLHAN